MHRLSASIGLKALDGVSAINPLPTLFASAREEADVFSSLVKGQVYIATVLGQNLSGEVRVSLNGKSLLLNMQPVAQLGDTLLLKYVDHPSQRQFKLLSSQPIASGQVVISQTAREVSSLVDAAREQGAAQVYQAYLPATRSPLQAEQMAKDLKHALESSGLFYESHLAEFAQGTRALNSLKLEPQNQQGLMSPHLLAQQLHVLETQRMHWSGEVWPGQLADWQVAVTEQSSHRQPQEPEAGVVSSVSLEMPCLGNIQAHLRLADGRLQVTIASDDPASTETLQKNANALVQALKQHVTTLDAILVQQRATVNGGVQHA